MNMKCEYDYEYFSLIMPGNILCKKTEVQTMLSNFTKGLNNQYLKKIPPSILNSFFSLSIIHFFSKYIKNISYLAYWHTSES